MLDGFRKNAFNVLVATNVVEEGLDVRSCNVVIKADELTNFRSFIQSQVSAVAVVCFAFFYVLDSLLSVALWLVSKCRRNCDRLLLRISTRSVMQESVFRAGSLEHFGQWNWARRCSCS